MINEIDSTSLPFELETIGGKIQKVSALIDNLKYVKFDIRNHIIFFRGHSNKSWDAKPSIYRDDFFKKEHIIFREIISSIPEEFASLNNTFQKLVKM